MAVISAVACNPALTGVPAVANITSATVLVFPQVLASLLFLVSPDVPVFSCAAVNLTLLMSLLLLTYLWSLLWLEPLLLLASPPLLTSLLLLVSRTFPTFLLLLSALAVVGVFFMCMLKLHLSS